MPKIASPFTVDKRDSTPVDWQGGQMTRSRFYKTFTGDIEGTSIVEAVMLMTDGPMVYVGIERFDVSIKGKKGSFLLTHTAVAKNDGKSVWTVVDASGTGELLGIKGSGEILPEHVFVLDYELTPIA
jgi:hypothetical protein